MSIVIKKIQTRSELLSYVSFTESIYRHREHRPRTDLMQVASPLFNMTLKRLKFQLFLALENDQPVGGVAAIIDPYSREADTGFWGAFEACEKPYVAKELLLGAEDWLARQKIKKIIGPATFNTNQRVGLLIEGFAEPPGPFMPYNPPYYQSLIENCGYSKLTDLLSYNFSLKRGIPDVFIKIAQRASRKDSLVVRPLQIFSLRREIEALKYALNESMADNWGYIPMTSGEVGSLLNYCLRFGDSSLILIAEVNKQPAAFSLCFAPAGGTPYPRLGLLGVVKKFRMTGLESLLVTKTLETLTAHGYSALEISQVDENNLPMIKIISKFCRPYKRHRVYQKDI